MATRRAGHQLGGRRDGSVALAAVACLAAYGLTADLAAAVQAVDPVPHVVVLAHGKRVDASAGAGEVIARLPNGDATVVHFDAPPGIPLLLHGHLTLRRGQRVVIDTSRTALSISGALLAASGPHRSRTVHATQLNSGGHRWAFVMPHVRRNGSVDRMNFEVIYHLNADGLPDQLVDYEAGVRLASRTTR